MTEQEIASQLVALEKDGYTKVFQEKISTRVHRHPEMEAALVLAIMALVIRGLWRDLQGRKD
jgi:hypothetical protein